MCLLLFLVVPSAAAAASAASPSPTPSARGAAPSSKPSSGPNHFDPKSRTQSTTHSPAPSTGPSSKSTNLDFNRHPVGLPQPVKFDLTSLAGGDFTSSDGLLEVSIPAGAVTGADVTSGGGKLGVVLRQVLPSSGSNAGGSGHYSFGSWLVQVVDASGHTAKQGLRAPVQLTLHYGQRASAVDVAHTIEVTNGTLPSWVNLDPASVKTSPAPRAPAASTPAPSTGPSSGARQNPPASNPRQQPASPTPVPGPNLGSRSSKAAQVNATAQTLSAAVTTSSATSSVSFDTDAVVATFGKPDPFLADLSGGALTANYPLDLPAGPGGLKPSLTLTYNSADVSGQHNPQGAAGLVGEGWNLGLGSISWAEHDVNSLCLNWAQPTGCTSNWEDSWQLSDPFGTSANLIPPNINVSAYNDDSGNAITPSPVTWQTAPATHARVISFQSPWPPAGVPSVPCFRVFLPNGIMEEFGCTGGSLLWYPDPSGANKGKAYVAKWLLDLITDANGNQIHVNYQQDVANDPATGVTYPRDAEISSVEWDSPTCVDSQTACTGAAWTPLMQVNFQLSPTVAHSGGNTCAASGGLRCDDPVSLTGSGGLAAPEIQNTFILNDAQVQVRAGAIAGGAGGALLGGEVSEQIDERVYDWAAGK